MIDAFGQDSGATKIPTENLRVLVNSAIRYALGRMSCITSLTADIVKQLPDEVWDKRCLTVALRDLEQYFEKWDKGYKTDMDCDHEIWKSLYNYLRDKEAKNERI